MASRILPEDAVKRLNAIDVDFDDPSGIDFTFVSKAKTELSALVPVVEDALASIDRRLVPPPNTDLPGDIKGDYEETGAIVELSPRGATALLRLCIQKLCIHLGGSGENLSEDIGALVKKGLSARVQKALDTVRVTGNNAVHPSTRDLSDDITTAKALFDLVNLIADAMITLPRQIDEMYNAFPESKREAIDRRDLYGTVTLSETLARVREGPFTESRAVRCENTGLM